MNTVLANWHTHTHRTTMFNGNWHKKVKLSLCLTKHHAMKTFWGNGVIAPRNLTSALDGGEWSASRPGRFTPRERAPGTHWIGGWLGPRAGLDTVVNRKIPSPRRESNPRTPIVQHVAQRYTDWRDVEVPNFISQIGVISWQRKEIACHTCEVSQTCHSYTALPTTWSRDRIPLKTRIHVPTFPIILYNKLKLHSRRN
jgi:hypothetical protein